MDFGVLERLRRACVWKDSKTNVFRLPVWAVLVYGLEAGRSGAGGNMPDVRHEEIRVPEDACHVNVAAAAPP